MHKMMFVVFFFLKWLTVVWIPPRRLGRCMVEVCVVCPWWRRNCLWMKRRWMKSEFPHTSWKLPKENGKWRWYPCIVTLLWSINVKYHWAKLHVVSIPKYRAYFSHLRGYCMDLVAKASSATGVLQICTNLHKQLGITDMIADWFSVALLIGKMTLLQNESWICVLLNCFALTCWAYCVAKSWLSPHMNPPAKVHNEHFRDNE